MIKVYRFFIDLWVQYMKIPCSEHAVNTNYFWFLNSKQIMYNTCSELGTLMYWTCNSMNSLLSYCGLVDVRISASEKDLPVHKKKGMDKSPKDASTLHKST